jgi:betaine-aldehyde dehydrogenase
MHDDVLMRWKGASDVYTRSFIDGRWSDAASGETFTVIDPATEETIAQIPACGAAEVQRAVEAAGGSFSRWSKLGAPARASWLRKIAAGIESQLEALAGLETLDNGKPLAEARVDIQDAVGCFRYYADLAECLDAQGDERVVVPDARFDSRVRRYPVGVVGQIIPWNYPLLMAAWKVAPALAAGCTVVLKPSELTPLTALALAAICADLELPRGVLNIVTGTGPECGMPLVQHPLVSKIAFTGSVPTGAAIAAAAAPAIKRVSLELGGKSPVIVFDDADIDAAVEWIRFGIFWNQGQVCSATSRLLVHESIADELLARLCSVTRRIRIGNGMQHGVQLGPMISGKQRQRVLDFIQQGVTQGAGLVLGGSPPAELARGYFLSPTIVDGAADDNVLWRDEVFGPVLSVRRFREEREALICANASRFGLAAAVLSSDPDRCERVADALEAGVVWINCSQPTFTEAPWGGMKMSGIGRELGRWGLAQYQEIKQITRYRSTERWAWYE